MATAKKKATRKKAAKKRTSKAGGKKAAPEKVPEKKPRHVPTRKADPLYPPAEGEPLIVNQTWLARWNGITEKRVYQWIKEGMPVVEPGKPGRSAKIDAVAAQKWITNRYAPTTGGQKSERERLYAIQAKKQELEVRRIEGELVEVEEVETVLSEMMIFFARNLDAISSRMANKLARIKEPAKIRRVLLDEIRAVRDRAADSLEGAGLNQEGR